MRSDRIKSHDSIHLALVPGLDRVSCSPPNFPGQADAHALPHARCDFSTRPAVGPLLPRTAKGGKRPPIRASGQAASLTASRIVAWRPLFSRRSHPSSIRSTGADRDPPVRSLARPARACERRARNHVAAWPFCRPSALSVTRTAPPLFYSLPNNSPILGPSPRVAKIGPGYHSAYVRAYDRSATVAVAASRSYSPTARVVRGARPRRFPET